MAPRGRPKKMVAGNTRMDAALDAMRPFGFEEKLIRQTVNELLDVYEGAQGWPFIEEASYKLLIETILGNQLSSVDEKEVSLQDNARKDGIAETSSAATPTIGIYEVGSSSLVSKDPVSHATDDLNSGSQTNNHHDSPSHGTLETDVRDTSVPTDRGGLGGDIRVESKKEKKSMDNVKVSHDKTLMNNVKSTYLRSSINESSRKRDNLMDNVKGSNDKSTVMKSPMIESSKTHDKPFDNVEGSNDKAFVSSDQNIVVRNSMLDSSKTSDKLMDDKGSNHETFVSNVDNTIVKSSMIESSKKSDKLPGTSRRPYHGWISDNNEVDLLYFPLPPLPERIEKLIGKGEASQGRRRKSRWDEKPDDM